MNSNVTKFNASADANTVKTWMIENYVRTSGAALLALCKPMQHREHVAVFPVSVEVLDVLTTCEYNYNAQEWRLRFRPSNGAFIRAAQKYAQGRSDFVICSTEELKARKEAEQARLQARIPNVNSNTIGMGHAFEAVLSDKYGREWCYDCTPYDIAGDIFNPDGVGVQCKRYGGSVHETSVVAALRRKGLQA